MTISCIPKRILTEIIYTEKINSHLFFFIFRTPKAEVDDEGIERDSEEIDDEKFLDSKELDHILEVSSLPFNFRSTTTKCNEKQFNYVGHEGRL